MKKLRLILQQMENAEVLTRSQLRNVLGGGGETTASDFPCETAGTQSCTKDEDCGVCGPCHHEAGYTGYYCTSK